MREALSERGYDPALVRVGHYGGLRGSNAYCGCDVILAQVYHPNLEALLREGRALFASDPTPLGERLVTEQRALSDATGATWAVAVPTFADPRLAALLTTRREAEMVQAALRGRPLDHPDAQITILSSLPLPGLPPTRIELATASPQSNTQRQETTIWVGVNDFSLTDLGRRIGDGSISPTEQQQRLARIVDNIAEAIRVLRAAGDVPILLAPIPDVTALPVVTDGSDANPARQARLRAAIAAVNEQLRQLAAREGVSYLDLNRRLMAAVQGRMVGSCITVGGVCIALTQGEAPTNLGLDAYWHPGTVVSGLIANAFIAELNTQLTAGIQPFPDAELLQIAGVTP